MMRLSGLFALLCAAPAAAADLEVAAEVASQPRVEAGWRRFGVDQASVAPGLRVALGVHRFLDVTASWHHTRFGATVLAGPASRSGVAAYTGNDASIGVRALLPVGDVFRITGEASALAHLGSVRFDDDPFDPGSPIQAAATAIAPGFRVAAGGAVHLDESALPTTLVLFADVGISWTTPLDFAPYGDLVSRGVSGRIGGGVRF